MSEDMEIEDYEERKQDLRDRVEATGVDAQMVFAADRLANVQVLREAYAVEGEDVDAELLVDLDLKILVWEYDMEMLFTDCRDQRLTRRYTEEMLALWRQRSAELRADL